MKDAFKQNKGNNYNVHLHIDTNGSKDQKTEASRVLVVNSESKTKMKKTAFFKYTGELCASLLALED